MMKTNKRNIYLEMQRLEEARSLWLTHFVQKTAPETIPSVESSGRVLAKPIFANQSSPNYHAAAMDGIAILAETTYGAHVDHPILLEPEKNAFFVNTGNVMPDNTDAVIMIENVLKTESGHISIEAPAIPWQHVRKMGEDIVATEMLFPQNHVITPYCIGAMLSGGVFQVDVRKKPEILIIPTGSELLDWQFEKIENAPKGSIIESNGTMLKLCAIESGAQAVRHDIVPDNQNALCQIIENNIAKYDMILLIGGSSAGASDFTRAVIEETGKVLLHGVTIMPGKPVVIGDVQQKPVVGIPGYPVSAIVIFDQFIRPMIYQMMGIQPPKRKIMPVQLTRNMPSKLGIEEFIRVKLGKVGENVVASSLPRGAGAITSFTQADGLIRIPCHSEGLKTNEKVYAELLKSESTIHNTIMAVGSHDNTLDILADQVSQHYPDIKLSSSHVGSLGGLLALRRGTCHLAGTHLLDANDGSYNVSYIKKYLPQTPVRCMHLVMREQGLIVLKNNPKKINSIADLKRKDVQLINRQSGSGTRVLLDYLLQKQDISPDDIIGYHTDEYTHMGVAVNVLSGAADVGMGILSAAKALNLGFIPIIREQYDLVIPEIYWETPLIQKIVIVIRTREFQQKVLALGGYHTDRTGELLTI
jgi:putative molybdopterin biosynthesis protein